MDKVTLRKVNSPGLVQTSRNLRSPTMDRVSLNELIVMGPKKKKSRLYPFMTDEAK